MNPITQAFVFSNKGTVFGALSHLALITSREGSPLTATLGYLLRQIWEGAWKQDWAEERADEVEPPSYFGWILTSAYAFHSAPVNLSLTYPYARMEMIF